MTPDAMTSTRKNRPPSLMTSNCDMAIVASGTISVRMSASTSATIAATWMYLFRLRNHSKTPRLRIPGMASSRPMRQKSK